jgi:outer membrane protein assembly factor BamB
MGQIIKLDPRKPDDPVVWSVNDQTGGKSGAWGTSAIWKDMVYADFNSGRVVGIDRATGEIVWEKKLPGPTWQSPVVVDDTLILGDCEGVLHAYDVSDTRVDPPELWDVQLSGCIESTPAVWKGRIFVGARGGRFYAIGDADLAPPGGPEGDPTWTGTTGPADSEGGGSGGSTVTTQRPTVTTADDGG